MSSRSLSKRTKSRSTEYKKTYNAMKRWLNNDSYMKKASDNVFTHNLNNLYFVWCGIRTACYTSIGPNGKEFAEKFGLDYKNGPYFDSVYTDPNASYFINKKYIREFEPLFNKLEDLHIVKKGEEDYAPKIKNERQYIVGTILGFDKKCVVKKNKYKNEGKIGITIFTYPFYKPKESLEVFAYTSNTNIKGWQEYPTNILRKAKKYLDPINLKIGFNVIDKHI